ncbi:substrate-binding domain-containing protein [Streptomyces sp. Pv4-95]|uniref:substrate-binding domain-containing protein n=1 Tax=Streptomyces sp. Pv4-95 TaxID=3049543 RepID=UPI0038927C5C
MSPAPGLSTHIRILRGDTTEAAAGERASRLSCLGLTAVSQGAEEQARYAVAAAVERLDRGRTDPCEVVLTPRLVVRGTVAEPR